MSKHYLKGKKLAAVLMSVMMLFSIMVPFSVSAEGDETLEITVAPKISFLNIGETESVELEATVAPDSANGDVVWSIDNDSVATVDPEDGTVTAVETGVATVTATFTDEDSEEEVSDTATICVNALKEIDVTSDKETIAVDETTQLTATVGADEPVEGVTWVSEDEAIATVDEDGVVTGVAAGDVTVYAIEQDDTYVHYGEIDITVEDAPIVDPGTPTLTLATDDDVKEIGVGCTLEVKVAFDPEEAADDYTLTWDSSDEEVATVEEGVVTGVSAGEVTITVTAEPVGDTSEEDEDTDSLSATIDLTVVEILPESIELDPTDATIEIGEELTIEATILPEDTTNQNIIWTTDEEAIATVDETGKVTGIGEGTVTITATCEADEEVFATCEIEVIPVQPKSVTVSPKISVLYTAPEKGQTDTVTLTAEVLPAEAEDKDVEWESDNPAVATVDEDGAVTAVSEGVAVITATSTVNDKLSDTATIYVDPALPTEIKITPDEAEIFVGDTVTLTAEVLPEEATSKDVVWSSEDDKIATVEDGVVTGIAVGTVEIYATSVLDDSIVGIATVTVNAVLPTGMEIDPTEAEIKVGEKLTITATFEPINTTDKSIKVEPQTEADSAFIEIDEDGVITGIAVGEATVTVTSVANDTLVREAIITVVEADPVLPEEMEIDPTEAEIEVGEELTITATFTPEDTTDKSIKVELKSEADAEFIEIDEDGVITGIAVGEATVTVTSVACETLIEEAIITVVEKTVFDPEVKRLSGENRIKTAIEVSKEGWDSADIVVLASGANFADALAGGPLANALDAPLLLTMNRQTVNPNSAPLKSIESEVLAQIQALNAKEVYILGGLGAVNEDIAKSLEAADLTVTRVSGVDRYDTAVKIAEEMAKVTETETTEVFIANGADFPDALAVSPVAAIKGAPILFSYGASSKVGNELNDYTKLYLASLENLESVAIVGGTGAVSDGVGKAISDTCDLEVDRVSGENRYLTAVAIYEAYKDVFTSSDVSLATGADFPDALAGSVLAAKNGTPVLLLNNRLEKIDDVATLIKEAGGSTVYVFGGTGVLTDKIVKNHILSDAK